MKPQRSFLLIFTALFCTLASEAQHGYYPAPPPPPPPGYYYYGPGMGGGVYMHPAPPHYRQRKPQQPKLPPFEPALHLNLGYGFPNLDQYYMADFYGAYKGNPSQVGPINASLDYQFSRYMSLGVMGMYGKVNMPYYDYNTYGQAMRGTLEGWTIMANMMNYIPAGPHVMPYLRVAMGVNIWNQDYVDYDAGVKVNYVQHPPDFAYQFSFGCKFNVSEHMGLFVEGGYGKYIMNAGLSFKL
ncbi:hypothetical protein QEG73_09945 [Chitinophagaceae bacterium 26-R-25]|nr:hypothetical protein [Chitinophagaceae bacterium 26-R-25]